jgi:hypothetical protein
MARDSSSVTEEEVTHGHLLSLPCVRKSNTYIFIYRKSIISNEEETILLDHCFRRIISDFGSELPAWPAAWQATRQATRPGWIFEVLAWPDQAIRYSAWPAGQVRPKLLAWI